MFGLHRGLCIFAVAIQFACGQDGSLDKLYQKTWADLQANWKDLGDFYQSQVRGAQDLWANTRQEMTIKVDETVRYLDRVQADRAKLIKAAKERNDIATQEALEKVDQMLKDAKEFQSSLQSNTAGSWDESRAKWQLKSTEMFSKGLDSVVNFTSSFTLTPTGLKSNSSATAEPTPTAAAVKTTMAATTVLTAKPAVPAVTAAQTNRSSHTKITWAYVIWISPAILLLFRFSVC